MSVTTLVGIFAIFSSYEFIESLFMVKHLTGLAAIFNFILDSLD